MFRGNGLQYVLVQLLVVLCLLLSLFATVHPVVSLFVGFPLFAGSVWVISKLGDKQ